MQPHREGRDLAHDCQAQATAFLVGLIAAVEAFDQLGQQRPGQGDEACDIGGDYLFDAVPVGARQWRRRRRQAGIVEQQVDVAPRRIEPGQVGQGIGVSHVELERQEGVGGIPVAPAIGATFLRGTQFADAEGWVRFKTVYPSWYGGRTPHLHFKVLLGGKAKDGLFFEPTIITGVKPTMMVAREETFGPVAPIFAFKDEKEAVRMANDTEFGLACYFYARDIGRVWRVAEGLEYGMVGINEGIISTEVAPFGGVKESGIGREGSKYGILDYTELKYLCIGGIEG